MNRVPKSLSYNFSKENPLKEERHSHRMKGKGGKAYRCSKPPRSTPKVSVGFSKDVHYGSHANVCKQIGEEMRRLGL